MTNGCSPAKRSGGYSDRGGKENTYSEERWSKRLEAASSLRHGIVCVAEFHDAGCGDLGMEDWLLRDRSDCGDSEPCPEPVMGSGKEDKAAEARRLAGRWTSASDWFAVMPTALLTGMYGAAVFSILSIGPVWGGLLLGVTPTLVLAAWAFTNPSGR